MPTERLDWLEVLLKNPPTDYLTTDDSDVLALVRAGYLEAVHCWNDLMLTWDTRYVLTLSGAAWCAGEPYARLHSAWRKRLAKALEREGEAA